MALPVIKYLSGFPALDPQYSFFNALYDGQFETATPGKLPLVTPYGDKIVFTGNFTVNSGGVVTDGTVTGFRVFDGISKLETGSGYEIPATELIAAVTAWQSTDETPLRDLLLTVPTKYVGSELGDFYYGISGDGSAFSGRQGDDELFANGIDITLKGGKGNDLLVGLSGGCDYSGGEGRDVFGFVDPATPNKIHDFDPKDDWIALNVSLFVGVEGGTLEDSQFAIGKQASTPEEIIIYQRGKGNLWYDQDGSDDTYAAVKFAKVDKGLDIVASNFFGDQYGPI